MNQMTPGAPDSRMRGPSFRARIARGMMLVGVAAATFASGAIAAAQEDVSFNRDIRPLLADRCYACHGPDEGQREADLRLDEAEHALADRDGAPVLVPGDREASILFQRIAAADEDERMPPADSGKTLSPEEIELIGKWIDEGARWEAHWSYLPPRRPEVPVIPVEALGDGRQVRSPIDAFIYARALAAGVQPSAPAEPRILARRLSLDLLGLPPHPNDVEAFVEHPSPAAYEQMVDRLLASPHFGERLAQQWLDLVRYADTNGIHGDNHRDHAPYRDYVIRSFNQNLPFDVFTVEQLAGDLLPDAGPWQQIASGYNRLNMTTREGGAQPKEYRAKYAADRVRNASSVWMGSTLGCAECHDHKFDPFTARDFYRFAAFFADIQETAVGVQQPTRIATGEEHEGIQRLDEQLAPLRASMAQSTPELEAAQVHWEAEARESLQEWEVATPRDPQSEQGAELAVQADNTLLASGENPDRDRHVVELEVDSPGVTGLRLEVLPHPSLPANGPGRAGNGNFVLSEIVVKQGERTIPVAHASASHEQTGWPVAAIFDTNPDTGWAVLPQAGQPNRAVVELAEDVTAGTLRVELSFQHGRGSHTLGHYRLSLTRATRPVRVNAGLSAGLVTALLISPQEQTAEQRRDLAAHYRTIAPQLAETRAAIAALEAERQALVDTIPPVLVSMSGPRREMRVLPRGNWLDDSGELVTPASPEFMPAGPWNDDASRADLAHWLVDPANPLVARVYVNRLWQLAFGEGLVRTPDDFGSQGDWPTHPELLDWLAVEFIESGWDVKHVMRLIVTSSAYRQSSDESPALRAVDPGNRFLTRQNRFRVDAEVVRDTALQLSGVLVTEIGGPSVRPYQPPGYWSHLNFPRRTYQADSGADQYRRGLYTYWCRTFLHPSMKALDAPSREECTVQRPRSNTPLAALSLLNDPTYVEAARVLARRVIREGGSSPDDRIVWVYREALLREPSGRERRVLADLAEAHLTHYRAHPDEAARVLENGQVALDDDLDPAELAAWTSVTRVVLNLHELITRR